MVNDINSTSTSDPTALAHNGDGRGNGGGNSSATAAPPPASLANGLEGNAVNDDDDVDDLDDDLDDDDEDEEEEEELDDECRVVAPTDPSSAADIGTTASHQDNLDRAAQEQAYAEADAAAIAAHDADAAGQWQRDLARERLVHAGWLAKRREGSSAQAMVVGRPRWKRRWFVLRAGALAYYKDEAEYAALGILSPAEIHSVTAIALSNKRQHCIAVVTRKRTYYLDAAARVEVDAWLVAFDQVLRTLATAPSVVSLSDLANIPVPPLVADTPTPAAPVATATTRALPLVIHPVAHDGALAAEMTPTLPGSPMVPPTPATPFDHLPAPIPTGIMAGYESSTDGEEDEDDDPDANGGGDKQLGGHTHRGHHHHGPSPGVSVPMTISSSMDSQVASALVGQFTHRVGWVWRYERANLAVGKGLSVAVGGKHWKRRWCVARGDRLLLYKDQREYSPIRIIPLATVLDVLSAPMAKGIDKLIAAASLAASSSSPPGTVLAPPPPPLQLKSSGGGAGAGAGAPTSPGGGAGAAGAGGEPSPAVTTASNGSAGDDGSTTSFHVVAAGKTYVLACETRAEMVAWIRELRRLVSPYQADAVVVPPQPATQHAGGAAVC
ncbi:hypothetical protein BC828DRAFT_405325 [Blastocladiella britannica]|nr:hypothetical protein BC828DRAFT_405325 [Blastocladiella britannica]